MKNSTIFLTRKCPRNCEYCDIHNPNSSIKQELTLEQWVEAFRILKEIGVTFNLILGNEAWLLKENLLTLLSSTTVPYALYTTCPEPLFTNYRDKFMSSGVLDNFSVAVDYPIYFLEDKLKNLGTLNDMEQKSYAGFKGLKWVREHYPEIDTQAQFTIHRKNFQMLPQVVKDCNEIGAFMGVNFLHWNKDGNYDFFPTQDVLKEFIFQPDDLPELKEIIEEVQNMPNLIQNIELFTEDIVNLTSMGGHCEGDPYGGPSVDSNGALRTCGYRQGTHCAKLSIFDLPEKLKEWEEAVRLDAQECPGCEWSFPWMYRYWKNRDEKFGEKVLTKHAGEHIDKLKWSKRILE